MQFALRNVQLRTLNGLRIVATWTQMTQESVKSVELEGEYFKVRLSDISHQIPNFPT